MDWTEWQRLVWAGGLTVLTVVAMCAVACLGHRPRRPTVEGMMDEVLKRDRQ